MFALWLMITQQVKAKAKGSIGIDLGLKDLATCSDGVKARSS